MSLAVTRWSPARLRSHLRRALLPQTITTTRRYFSRNTSPTQNSLPASYYRGGTSRGVMFNKQDLPAERDSWDDIFRGIIGSPDRYGRQLDGLGAGVSSLSKVCIVGKPDPSLKEPGDVTFTFAHLDTKWEDVDYSGNCGNMLSAVGPFAWDAGIVDESNVKMTKEGEVSLKIYNTNTKKIIRSTFPLADGGKEAAASGGFSIDGVEGTGPKIRLDFMDPGGAKTGMILPSGEQTNVVEFPGGEGSVNYEMSCVDVANPCVFMTADSLKVPGNILPDDPMWEEDGDLRPMLESLRRMATVRMGMAKDMDAAADFVAVPKMILVSKPTKENQTLQNEYFPGRDVDIIVRAMSMGLPHRAIPITAAICTAAACRIPGTVVNRVYEAGRRRATDAKNIRIGHPSGIIEVDATFDKQGKIISGTVYRTARRLMEGRVFWK